MSFKAAHLLTQNFATLASGILIGMSQGLGAKRAASKRTAKSARGRKLAKTTRRATPKAGKGVTAKPTKRRKTVKRTKAAARKS